MNQSIDPVYHWLAQASARDRLAKIKELEAENERLRAALEEIADGAKVTLDVSHPWVGKVARDALGKLPLREI